MLVPTVLSLVALSLQCVSAAIMFLIARAPGWGRVRLMGCIAVTAGAFSSVNLIGSLLTDGAPALRWLFEISLCFAAAHATVWVWYTFSDPKYGKWRTIPVWRRIHALSTVGFTLAVAVAGRATDPDVLLPVTPGIRGAATETFIMSGLGNAAAALVILMFASCQIEYLRRVCRGEKDAIGIAIGFVIFGICVVDEMLVAAGIIDFYYLADVGYLFIVLPLSAQLLQRFSADARRLANLSNQLADEVEVRTTERDEARVSLLEQQRLAALGRLAAGVGHEINNALQYLLFNLEELRLAAAQDGRSDVHTALEQALEGADRIRRVVESLRRYGVAAERFSIVDLHEVVRVALRIAEPQLRRAVTIRTELDTVPKVLGDEGQLVQMLVNPLVNAAQALGHAQHNGDACITIRTYTSPDGEAVIVVEDNGTGFPSAILPRLGEPYVTTRASSGGTGLGIFVTQGLVTTHAGHLVLENSATGGAVVRVTLPPAPTTVEVPIYTESTRHEEPRRMRTRRTRSGEENDFSGMDIPLRGSAVQTSPPDPSPPRRILVVDDEPVLLQGLARALRRMGHQVETASDASTALQLMDSQPFDLVLSDLMMPKMSGVALASAMERSHPELRKRLLIMTGGAVTVDDSHFLARPDVIVVDKPVQLAALARIIDSVRLEEPVPVG